MVSRTKAQGSREAPHHHVLKEDEKLSLAGIVNADVTTRSRGPGLGDRLFGRVPPKLNAKTRSGALNMLHRCFSLKAVVSVPTLSPSL